MCVYHRGAPGWWVKSWDEILKIGDISFKLVSKFSANFFGILWHLLRSLQKYEVSSKRSCRKLYKWMYSIILAIWYDNWDYVVYNYYCGWLFYLLMTWKWLSKFIFHDLFSPSSDIFDSLNISWVLKPWQATSFLVCKLYWLNHKAIARSSYDPWFFTLPLDVSLERCEKLQIINVS